MRMMGSRVFAIMVVVAGMLLLGNLPEASAECGVNFSVLYAECRNSFQDDGPPPSTQCCDQLRKVDQECARAYVDGRPGIEQRSGIDFDRAVAVTRACGINIPPYPAPAPSPQSGD
ncbi:unnamed protein product [Sphenostylis stenocarpa]|uniref:Bifunctional inhibitor/plant lipid transfer protein/seed storage helical domain-containing protein n=1 Tax=Sphenostylis stenocarpa TaxID=92480 RepID=A0AA86SRX1_9FABA|nr:unnamed protein product [Sphenostylis stenocarpa]